MVDVVVVGDVAGGGKERASPGWPERHRSGGGATGSREEREKVGSGRKRERILESERVYMRERDIEEREGEGVCCRPRREKGGRRKWEERKRRRRRKKEEKSWRSV